MSIAPTRFLLCGLVVALGLWPAAARPAAPPVEHVDKEYQFAFQYPADWRLQDLRTPGVAGDVRVAVKNPAQPTFAMGIVGRLKEAVTKPQFERDPNRDALVARMIEQTIEQIYRKISRDVRATGMTVAQRQRRTSAVGIKFYISTTHTTPEGTVQATGIHVVPFGKLHFVAFVVVSRPDSLATEERETLTRMLDSFHLAGERPAGAKP